LPVRRKRGTGSGGGFGASPIQKNPGRTTGKKRGRRPGDYDLKASNQNHEHLISKGEMPGEPVGENRREGGCNFGVGFKKNSERKPGGEPHQAALIQKRGGKKCRGPKKTIR